MDPNFLRPSDFGAVGGGADDTAAIQATFDAIAGAQRIVLIDDDHVISDRISVTDKSDFLVCGGGSLKMADGTPVASDYQMLLFARCSNFMISQMSLDGNRDNRMPAEVPAHVLEFRSCHDYRANDVVVLDSPVDGIYLNCAQTDVSDPSKHNYDFVFDGCSVINSYRQGVSVIQGRNGTFRNCRFIGSNGTLPQAGVDLESNSSDIDTAIRDIAFEDCLFEGAIGYGLLVASAKTPKFIRATRCLFKDNVAGAVSWQGQFGALVDCTFDGFDGSTATRGMIDIGAAATAGDLTIIRPFFYNIINQSSGRHLYYVHSASSGRVKVFGGSAVCQHIGNLKAPNCSMTNGDYTMTGSVSAALAIGPGGKVDGVRISGFTGEAILVMGDDAAITNNLLTDPVSNTASGVIRVYSGVRVIVCGNQISRSLAGDGYGVTVGTDTGLARLCDNSVSGFSAHPYALDGTVSFKRGNIADGVLQSETPIMS